jgi:hypothetical protein
VDYHVLFMSCNVRISGTLVGCFLILGIKIHAGRAIARPVSRQLPIATARVRSRVKVMWDLRWKQEVLGRTNRLLSFDTTRTA